MSQKKSIRSNSKLGRFLTWGIWFIDPPKDISLDGHRIDHVIQYTDFVVTLYFGLVVLALLYFIFRYNWNRNPRAAYDEGNTKKHVALTVGMGLLVFFSIDFVIESMSFHDLKEVFWNFPKDEGELRVEVMPQQFAWNFRYAGDDGEFGTDDDIVPPQNMLHIPVNTPVVTEISTWDVIHSFYLPNFRLKQDATPGMITAMWFQAKEEGEYEIACAELCGNSHYKMQGRLTVESKEKFNEWINSLKPIEEEELGDEWGEEVIGNIPQDWGWKWKALK